MTRDIDIDPADCLPELFRHLGYQQLRADDDPDRHAAILPPRVRSCRQGMQPLTEHLDPRGTLCELWRESWGDAPVAGNVIDPNEGRVRQVYVSGTLPDTVKGWHLHARQTDRFVCIEGRVIVCTCDLRDLVDAEFTSSGEMDCLKLQVVEHLLDARTPRTLVIPPGWAHGWWNPGPDFARILNMCSHEYDGTDEWRLAADEGPVGWRIPLRPKTFDWRHPRDG